MVNDFDWRFAYLPLEPDWWLVLTVHCVTPLRRVVSRIAQSSTIDPPDRYRQSHQHQRLTMTCCWKVLPYALSPAAEVDPDDDIAGATKPKDTKPCSQ
jgi:hypothetical protein